MNEDKLRKLIKEGRSEFESEGPHEGLWGAIHTELHGKEEELHKPSSWRKWAVAAAVSCLVILSAWILLKDRLEPEHELFSTEPIDKPYLSDDIAEVDYYYASQVSAKTEELSHYNVDPELMEEMTILNEEFLALKAEMGQGMDDNKVVEAMIENYRLRLSLLEDLVEALEPMATNPSKKKNERHEL